MKLNMGTIDRVIRFIIAIIIGALYLTGVLSGTVALILETIAVIFLLTSFIGWCPVYALFGLSTRKKEEGSKKDRG
jgi:hypothetical protein